ncbi:glycosyltransferase family 2 protein [Beijerinckia sp. L45]|uniref:glycosyltransferase family 2 protein n=1 Tax=Beijerinckia sp. L45 TaxID=1641855 RepID=UPI00131E0111|nr:glycosyltransferase [Beijerinckia sp. L45]
MTVVIVNYNYGRFLQDAVESVFGQTYSDVECIVVDNASTDETPAVLAALQARHPDMIVLRRAANDGQTPASLDGLAASTGEYVIFLDADDYLLPKCVETHVYVHLSMRPHIGFTSGDMLQVAENKVVVSTGEESNRYIRGGKGYNPSLVRPYTAEDGWPSAAVSAGIADKIHYVPPLAIRWVWSPTSGLCYRRDALRLFADNPRLQTLRTGTDLYFAYGCGGLSGSVVIDEPLFAYRIHGGNIFTAHAQLDRTLNYTVGGHGDSNILAQLYLIDHLVDQVDRFTPNPWLRAHFLALLFKVDHADPNPKLPAWARRSRAAQAIVRDYDAFAEAVGAWSARWALLWFSKSPRSAPSLLASLRRST